MRVHNATVSGRLLEVDDRMLVQGTSNSDLVHIDLDPDWDGLSIEAIFTSTSGASVAPAVSEDGWCTVPHEVLLEPGGVYITVIGSSGGTVVANAVMARPMEVRPRIMVDLAPAPSDPTETEYRKVYKGARALIESLEFSLGDDGHALCSYEGSVVD